ncbi:Starch-binding associating with outer membrane [Chitinophaga sp. YR573]|uniref:RagB/SusD family nutrient uptake outer membrane protein n=1 Tax=Chitinophaga sp. YR573 TaxID=1881040 RepID=UPI0008B30B0E|nr:RagB/SusD family nutrient uptake outer membrane protein [Chitinophaga sp. YR573]SEW26100.1 Starch-binding associating with outer membrane [Chitinophaga sp. YR573]
MKTKYKKLIAFFAPLLLSGCEKFNTVDTPINKTSTESAFTSDLNAAGVVNGIYGQMSNNYIFGYNIGGTCFFAELSADNLVINPDSRTDLSPWYQNFVDPTYSFSGSNSYWNNIYTLMYTINSSIEALTDNKNLTPAVNKRLLGEAYFLRSFCYFYLVNLYGDVPLILTSDYTANIRVARNSVSSVYDQIVTDLGKAEGLLDNTYVGGDAVTTTTKRLRPNLAAVNALQARVFLYQKNYAGAEAAAAKVIAQSEQYAFTDLNSTFLANSKETIWALQSVNLGYNTFEAYLYTITDQGITDAQPSYLSASFMKSFEPGDDRKNKWTDSTTVSGIVYPYVSKYKRNYLDGSANLEEYPIVLRFAEQYLIRAEARNEQGNTTGAVDDLNALRARSRAAVTADIPNPLPDLSSSLTKDQLKPIILNERRVELFTEWGHRWFDLKRSSTMDAIMIEAEKYKGGTWVAYKSLYPIPVSEMLLNGLLTQNPGYTK